MSLWQREAVKSQINLDWKMALSLANSGNLDKLLSISGTDLWEEGWGKIQNRLGWRIKMESSV